MLHSHIDAWFRLAFLLARSLGKEEKAFCWEENYGEISSACRKSDIHKRWLERDGKGMKKDAYIGSPVGATEMQDGEIESIGKIFFAPQDFLFFGNESRSLHQRNDETFYTLDSTSWYLTLLDILRHRRATLEMIRYSAGMNDVKRR